MADVRADILSVLSRRARFVPELARLVHAETPELERTLSELEADGAVLVREQYCADPHMVGTDLRIAARVPEPSQGNDPLAAAIAQIEATWQRWLGDYLANHRCS
jgi:predicted transcriptional regulator